MEYQPVLQTFERFADDVLSVKVAGEFEPVGVTSEHPFFVRVHGARSDTSSEDDGEWRKSGELNIGDEIRTATSDWSKVESIESRKDAQVYNFEVANNHNYFVGNQGLLVHNTCYTPDQDAVIQLAKDAKKRGGVTTDEANTLKDWAEEYNLPSRGPEAHPGRGFGSNPHIHVGPVNHLPIK